MRFTLDTFSQQNTAKDFFSLLSGSSPNKYLSDLTNVCTPARSLCSSSDTHFQKSEGKLQTVKSAGFVCFLLKKTNKKQRYDSCT